MIKSSKRVSIFFVIVSIIILILLRVELGSWYSQKVNNKEIKITPLSVSVGVALPSSMKFDDISEWDTYRNDVYGFEIKHPPFGVINITKANDYSPHGDWGKQIGELVAFQIGGSPLCKFNATVYSNPKKLSLIDFWRSALSNQYQIKNYKNENFGKNSIQGIRVNMERPGEKFPNMSVAVLMNRNNNIVMLFWWGENLTADRQEECLKTDLMLSTFKFLE